MHSLIIPDDVLRAATASERELREDVAVLLYQKGVPLGKAGSVAGLGRLAFRHLLAVRGVPLSYDPTDFESDLATLHRLNLLTGDTDGSDARTGAPS